MAGMFLRVINLLRVDFCDIKLKILSFVYQNNTESIEAKVINLL